MSPGVMLLWAATITVLVVLAMLPWFAGLLVAGPVIGHASWHAYRESVAPPTAGQDRSDHAPDQREAA
jgi:uncharacterized membrane protein